MTKDTLLYTMDSSDAQDSMDRAQISVQQAQMSYQQAQEALHPTAPISGTVSEIYVHNGESVTAGNAAGEDRGQHGAVHRLPVPLCLPQ